MPPLDPGLPYPLGATLRDGGVNFAVASDHAEAIELCLFDDSGRVEQQRLALPAQRDGVRHGFLRGAGAGLVYGLRAHGPVDAAAGHRFNPRKLLLDPYAREIVGRFEWRDEHYDHGPGRDADNTAFALKARVAAPLPPRRARPQTRPDDEVVLYEVHVKGFTRQHPQVPQALRGTYAGLAHPAAVVHLKQLGVTTLSLLPVHYALTESRLAALGLANYWGYNTLGFFCPDPRLSTTPDDCAAARREFRAMVETLHEAGLEVLLDVVFNHTAESDETGPTLSLRGLDNAMYYRLLPGDPSRNDDLTGCGNTIDITRPRVLQWVLDCLRCWVEEMGVDGFRFDLATVLGRGARGFDPQAPFFAAVAQDPVLAAARLVAEPWDLGPGGYQLGHFPGRWQEWNDRYRDGMRRYWLTGSADRAEFARRLLASSDRFHHDKRPPLASVNFITAHDGFTLRDLLSYEHKHNEANGEANRDGHHANYSVNCGVEGPSDDQEIVAERARLSRALLATLAFSQGTPMFTAGDEIGHSQQGNNNAYCQDNTITWLDWTNADGELADFVSKLLALRRTLPALRQGRWLSDGIRADGGSDVDWRDPAGEDMDVARWHAPGNRCLAVTVAPPDADAVLLLVNPERSPQRCRLPARRWRLLLDSSAPQRAELDLDAAVIEAPAQSLLLLQAVH